MGAVEQAFETLEKERSRYQREIKDMESRHRQLQGERDATLSDHRLKMEKLKAQIEKEKSEIEVAIEPLRKIYHVLQMDVSNARKDLEKAQNERRDVIGLMRSEKQKMTDELNRQITEKQKTLDGIQEAIHQARVRIGL